MKKATLLCVIFFVTHASFTSCKKKKSDPEPDPIQTPAPTPTPAKTAKFELTGNYTGQLFVVYNNNLSGNTSLTVTTLPWSKTLEYPANVLGIGIGANSVMGYLGAPGQVVNLKIYNGSTVVKSSSATADANGVVNLPTLAYVFP